MFYDENILMNVEKIFSVSVNLKWCYGKVVIINSDGSEYNREDPPEFSFRKLMLKNFISHPTTFIRKDFFVELGGFKNYKYAMDYDLWLRASRLSFPVKINYFLSKFRRHSNSLSTKEYINTLNEDYSIRKALKKSFLEQVRDYLNFKKNMLLYKLFLIKEKLI
jgi:GT2 family glycosyltransferase